jgi:hypothetical protein
LTADLLQEPGLIIVMSTEHRSALAETFRCRNVHRGLWLSREPLPNAHEVVSDHETNPVAVETHVRMIDRIIALTPELTRPLAENALIRGKE